MKCSAIKEWLDQNFTADGVVLSDDISRHLAECPECNEYYSELVMLQDQLKGIEDITLTELEEQALMQGLETSLDAVRPASTGGGTLMRWLTLIVRPAAAFAAVLVLALGSWQYQSQTVDIKPIVDQMTSTNVSGNEALENYLNNEMDNLSALIDQSSVTYLTSEIPSRQAEEILDNVSEEEFEWLLANMEVEI